MEEAVSREFVASLHAGLAFWRAQLSSRSVAELELERHNLYRAVVLGLSVPGTQAAAAEMAAESFNFVLARGYHAEWLALMERACRAYPPEPVAARFWVLTRLGQLLRLNYRLQESFDVHQQALDVARDIGEPLLLAEAHYHVGRALRDAVQGHQANEHLREAVRILEQVEGEYARRLAGLVVNALGRVAHDLGRFDEARQHLEQSVVIARALHRNHPLSERLLDLAHLNRVTGLYEHALANYEEALSLLPEAEYQLDRLKIQYGIGILHFSRADYARAEQTFRALDWAFLRDTGNLSQQAHLVNSLGNSVLYQQRYDEAVEILRQAVALWEELGDDLELANSTGSLGEALAGMGKKEEAAAMFARAIELLTPYADSSMADQLRTFFAGEKAKLAEQEKGAVRNPAPPAGL